MTLRKRLSRLEAQRGIGADPLTIQRIIFAAAWREGEGVRAEPEAAMLRGPDGWCTILREAGESEIAFLDRINR